MSNLPGINQIFERLIKGEATQEERLLFWEWLDVPENENEARKLIEHAFPSPESPVAIDSDTMETIIQAILNAQNHAFTAKLQSVTDSAGPSAAGEDLPPTPVRRMRFLKTAWFRAAAALLLVCGTAAYLYLNNLRNQEPVAQKTGSGTLSPENNKAILTQGDGSQILLDNAANGSLALQGNTKIIKLSSGSLVYNTGTAKGEVLYNTITTPRGGQYQVTLPDGSRVWLNAASSIRFPTVFTGERVVKVTGEAYFEIEQNKTSPFLVNAGDVQVQVLGTSFNINAYTDETTIKTTLIEGSVRVNTSGHLQKLTPGQQAQLTRTGSVITVKADLDKVMAWKNGMFNFKDADLPTVMRQLERWYDIQVKYEGAVPVFTFQGELERGLQLSQVLKILKDQEVKFRQEGRSLIIMQ